MARPQRNDVDYFPFYCKQGATTEYVESAYGNDGFAVWVKILRELATTNYHFLNLADRKKVMTFVAKCKVTEELLFKIITDLVELGEFDAELWNENKVVWGSKFTDSIEDAYKKRINKIFKKDEVIQVLVGLGVRKPNNIILSVSGYPQSKVEESKVENTREEVSRVTVGEKSDVELLNDFVPSVSREAEDLKDAICDYFDVKKILTSRHYAEIDCFVETIRHRNELPIVASALKNYVAYKARSQEQKHGFQKWIGSHGEHYNDGIWFTTDWEKKLKNYERQGFNGINGTNSTHQVAGTDYTGSGLKQTTGIDF
jgi:hypothetical protein